MGYSISTNQFKGNTMYKKALKSHYKFKTIRGIIHTEDLFDLPLTGNKNFNLDEIAKTIDADIQQDKRTSFVETTPVNPTNANKLELVKDIIADKIAEKQKAEQAASNTAKRQQILRLLAEKQDNALAQKSEEELIKELDALA